VEPIDIHPSVRHLDTLYDLLTLSDRFVHAYSLGRQRNVDGIDMIKIARQIDENTLQDEPSIMSVINANSPLVYDTPMLQGIIEFSSRNQVICITPFTLAGAMAPITVAGAIAQHNAEALAGIAFTQVVRPGAPVIYGGFTSNVDMQSGAPAFGTPEYMQTALITGQLTRRYNLPYRSSGVNAANAIDAQAAYESVFSLWGAVMGGAHMLIHAIGWLEGGLRASFEKMATLTCAAWSRHILSPSISDRTHWPWTPFERLGLGATFSALSTHSIASATRSTDRSSQTGAITRPGKKRENPRPRNG